MTAPVSLAELRKRGLSFGPYFDEGHIRLSKGERDALVELAEAYLEFVATDPYRDDEHKGPEGHRRDSIMRGRDREHGAARARLALAAKGVRP